MRTTPTSLLAAATAALVLAACTALPPASAAAVVGDTQIPRERIERAVTDLDLDGLRDSIEASLPLDLQGPERSAAVATEFEAVVLDTQRRILDLYIRFAFVERIAADAGAEASDADLDDARDQLLVSIGGPEALEDVLQQSRLTEAIFEEVIVPQEALVVALRRTLLEDQTLEVRASRHILLSSAVDAEEVLADLADGRDFAELARERSEDSGSAAQGGELGPQPRGAWLDEFDDAVWAAEVGAVVGPVQTQAGFHVIEVVSADSLGAEDLSAAQVQQLTDAELEARFTEVVDDTEVAVDPAFGTWAVDASGGATVQPFTPVGLGAARPLDDLEGAPTQDELDQLLEQLEEGS